MQGARREQQRIRCGRQPPRAPHEGGHRRAQFGQARRVRVTAAHRLPRRVGPGVFPGLRVQHRRRGDARAEVKAGPLVAVHARGGHTRCKPRGRRCGGLRRAPHAPADPGAAPHLALQRAVGGQQRVGGLHHAPRHPEVTGERARARQQTSGEQLPGQRRFAQLSGELQVDGRRASAVECYGKRQVGHGWPPHSVKKWSFCQAGFLATLPSCRKAVPS